MLLFIYNALLLIYSAWNVTHFLIYAEINMNLD